MNAWLSVSFGYLSALPFYLAGSRWSVRERRFHLGNLVFNGLRLAVGLGVLVPRLRKVCGLVISPALLGLQVLIAAVVSCSRQTHHGSSSSNLSHRGTIPGEPVQHSQSHQGQQEQDQQTDQRRGTN